jgi:RNA-directed DNA polymerase
MINYADDFVVLCESEQQAQSVKDKLTPWLTDRGLAFNQEKTRITHLNEGFDFLGFNIRRYGCKLLIKPSAQAIKRIKERLSAIMGALRGANVKAVLREIIPVLRGWAAYYRGVVSTEVFSMLDHHLWQLTYKWATHTHPNKPKHWVVDQYFGRFRLDRQDKWVFGDRETGAYLPRFAWTGIRRHVPVKGASSPDDPALTGYWTKRRRKARTAAPLSKQILTLLYKQDGRCACCGGALLPEHQPATPEESERGLRAARKAITQVQTGLPDSPETRLIHISCKRRFTAVRKPASAVLVSPLGPA